MRIKLRLNQDMGIEREVLQDIPAEQDRMPNIVQNWYLILTNLLCWVLLCINKFIHTDNLYFIIHMIIYSKIKT